MNRNYVSLSALFGCFAALGLTFLIAIALIHSGGVLQSGILRYAYLLIIFSCPIILAINLFFPVFSNPVIARHIGFSVIFAAVIIDILVFQAIVIFGLDRDDLLSLYLKHFVLLQIVNLFYLWICVCAVVGQGNFHPFFKELMRNPLGAIGYLAGYKLMGPKKKGQ